jgi:hypothetical protein
MQVKQGSPELLFSFEQRPVDVRTGTKDMGCDAGKYCRGRKNTCEQIWGIIVGEKFKEAESETPNTEAIVQRKHCSCR